MRACRYAQSSGFDEQEVLRQLPPPMALELLNTMYRRQITAVPMFRKLEPGVYAHPATAHRTFHAIPHGIMTILMILILIASAFQAGPPSPESWKSGG